MPGVGIEPTTYRLQGGCSPAELARPGGEITRGGVMCYAPIGPLLR